MGKSDGGGIRKTKGGGGEGRRGREKNEKMKKEKKKLIAIKI